MIYFTWCEHANHYTTDALLIQLNDSVLLIQLNDYVFLIQLNDYVLSHMTIKYI